MHDYRTKYQKKSIFTLTKLTFLCTVTVSAFIEQASATNGFLGHCIGPFKCGTGGAGAASATSAVDAMVNPALISKQENNLVMDLRLLHVNLDMDTSSAPIGNKVGKQKTRLTDFPDFSAGAIYKINEQLTVGIAMAASGGMATKYKSPRTNTAFQDSPPFDRTAMYRLAHFDPSISWKLDYNISIGGSLLIGYSDFKTDSAKATPQGVFAQTNGHNKRQNALGYGGRVGLVWDVSHLVSFGASCSTPVFFKKFTKYTDVLLGPINTPINFVIGSNWHITDSVDLLFDVKQVLYKKVKAIGRSPANGGFGWNNQTIFMTGVTKHYDKWSVSLGYSYGKSPISKDKTFANGLFPAIVEQHFTAGLGYKIIENTELRFGGFYVPKKTQTDPGSGDKFSKFGQGTKINMSQYGVFLGTKYNF